MGLFDFLTKKTPQSAVQKYAARVSDKRGMAPDRWEAIQALSKIDSEEAVSALLVRFTFYVDPTITDQEEKDGVFSMIVGKGELAVGPVLRFARKAESLAWPLKMLDRLLPADKFMETALDLLSEMDTEYERDPQRKLQLLGELEARRAPGIVATVLPFLDDVHEPARFHAASAVLAQEEREQAREALASLLAKEESMRIKARILQGFAEYGWSVPAEAQLRLPDGFRIGPDGVPQSRK